MKFSLKTIEKLSYLIGVPTLLAFSGYKLYQSSLYHEDLRNQQLVETEGLYLEKHKENLIKLDNFKKKIFAIGIEEDYLRSKKELTEENKLVIGQNAKLIRDLIKDVKPDTVLLELCQDRYDNWLYDIVSHPNYDKTMDYVHKKQCLLDKGEIEQLLDYKNLDFDTSHLEMLVGMDVCQYRMMPCNTVLGDRSIVITEKRYKSKLNMLDVYKEAATQKNSKKSSTNLFDQDQDSQGVKTIFDLDSNSSKSSDQKEVVKGDDKQVENLEKLRNALQQIQDTKQQITQQVIDQILPSGIPEKSQNTQEVVNASEKPEISQKQDSANELIRQIAQKQAGKTQGNIFDEVVIEEINEELLKSVQKCEGNLVIMLMRKERLKSFEKMWKQANLDYQSRLIKPHDSNKTGNKGRQGENKQIKVEEAYQWQVEESLFSCWSKDLRDGQKLIFVGRVGRDGFCFKVQCYICFQYC